MIEPNLIITKKIEIELTNLLISSIQCIMLCKKDFEPLQNIHISYQQTRHIPYRLRYKEKLDI